MDITLTNNVLRLLVCVLLPFFKDRLGAVNWLAFSVRPPFVLCSFSVLVLHPFRVHLLFIENGPLWRLLCLVIYAAMRLLGPQLIQRMPDR